MKLKFLVLLSSFVFVFAACDKSNDVTPLSKESLIGKWSLKGISAQIDDLNLKASEAQLKKYKSFNIIWDFKSDNTVNIDGDYASYVINKDEISINYVGGLTRIYKVVMNGNNLSLNDKKIDLSNADTFAQNSFESVSLLFVLFLFEDQDKQLIKLDTAKSLQLEYQFAK